MFSEYRFILIACTTYVDLHIYRFILNPYLEFTLTVNDLLRGIINLSCWSILELADFGSNSQCSSFSYSPNKMKLKESWT